MSSPLSPPPRADADDVSETQTPPEERASVEVSPGLTPVETDTRHIIVFGTALFGLALLGLLALRLAGVAWAVAHPSWTWTALAGCVLGLMGLVIVERHRRLGRTR